MESVNNPLKAGDLVGVNKEKIVPFKVLEVKGKRVVVSDEKSKKKNLPVENVRPWEALRMTIARLKERKKKKIDFHEYHLDVAVANIKNNLKHYPPEYRQKLEGLNDDQIWLQIAKESVRLGLEKKPPSIWDIELRSYLRQLLHIERKPIVIKSLTEKQRVDLEKAHESIVLPKTWEQDISGKLLIAEKDEAVAFFKNHGFTENVLALAAIAVRGHKKVFFLTAGFNQSFATAQNVSVQEIKTEKDLEAFQYDVPDGVFFVR